MDKNAMAFAVVVAALLVSSSIFYLGYSISQPKPSVASLVEGPTNNAEPSPQVEGAEEEVTTGSVSVDDDPVLGSNDAKVVVVEFSDFECPFCARHSANTTPEMKTEYIDTGKVKLVYRDTPFHGDTAIAKANAANCAREFGGDDAFFSVKDEIYRVLDTERRDITDEEIKNFVVGLGIGEGDYTACVAEERYQDEILKDLSDSQSYGVRGTPHFYIGIVNDTGIVEGESVSGAQPYAVFRSVIEKYLEE